MKLIVPSYVKIKLAKFSSFTIYITVKDGSNSYWKFVDEKAFVQFVLGRPETSSVFRFP